MSELGGRRRAVRNNHSLACGRPAADPPRALPRIERELTAARHALRDARSDAEAALDAAAGRLLAAMLAMPACPRPLGRTEPYATPEPACQPEVKPVATRADALGRAGLQPASSRTTAT